MYPGTEQFLTGVAVVSGIVLLCGLLRKAVQWVDRQKTQDEEIQSIRSEEGLLCYGILAALDGLNQLGANGEVTEAKQKIEKHLNQMAHHE